ncbi:MAG: class II fructose-bisphosphate aldolase [Clostridiales bacterium]|nr:class II fructose-bisphosphate aldolase [Clostridiales bacterium]
MTLIKVNDMLRHATEHKYGVPAINVFNYETILWVVKAAEQERVPIIIQFFPGFQRHIPLKYVAYIATDFARQSATPIAVHLDHSSTAEMAVAGIRDGFPSVMVDGSSKPFDENIVMTGEVVRTARIFGVDVEAELGHVGSGANLSDFQDPDLFTKPEDAAKFVELTGCDSLAIAVGNAHGAYKEKPNLDFARIAAIREQVTVPLVMHGGSDIPEDQVRKAVELGITKFNIATEYDRAYYNLAKEAYGDPQGRVSGFGVLQAIESKIIEFLVSKIRLLNPKGITF